MEFLNYVSKGKKLTDDAFDLGKIASAKKQENDEVINGILGTFYYDGGVFKTHDIVRNTINNLSDRERFVYSTSDGGEAFGKSCLDHFFGHTLEGLKKDLNFKVVATPGGTGALVGSILTTLNPGDSLLIPFPCWGPYFGIGEQHGFKVETYFLFDDDKFNLKGFKEIANEIVNRQHKLVFFLNDPCNNPTGYTLTEGELNELIDYLNSLSCPVVMVYDSAYIDMDARDGYTIRDKFKLFSRVNENVIISVALSYSKTFFIYGERLGAQIICGKNASYVEELYTAGCFLARNTWSNCNKAMISMVSKIIDDKEIYNKFLVDLNEIKQILKRRSDAFLASCKKVGIKPFPYQGGFFISFPCENPKEVCNKLIEENVYILPVKGIIRVAICSITEHEARILPEKINKYLKNNLTN